jgi:RNA ligase (TIGR02306 family)
VKEIAASVNLQFEVTEKLEGSSMTCYLIDGVFGVCSRNLDLKETADNTFWQVARKEQIEEKMRACGDGDWAIQGELIGPGIQGNIYNLSNPEFHVFDVYNIQAGDYLMPVYRRALIDRMGLKHVPVLNENKLLHDVEAILSWADGASNIGVGPLREGIVFKQIDGGMTFKAISNKYLLGEK